MRKAIIGIAATASLAGCSEPAEQWMLIVQGNRMNASSVSTKFAVQTGRTFSDRGDCVKEIYRLGALTREEQVSGLIDDEHTDIRPDYACIRIQ